jgi:hypothetical protein
MNIEDRVARMRASLSPQTQAAPAEKKLRVEQFRQEAAVEEAPSSEKVFDIANNSVAKLMDRGDLSDAGKLDAVVAFLTADFNNYNTAQKHFAEFEAYFIYEQSKQTQGSEQHIQRLMSELHDGTKSTIETILRDFNTVNDGAGNIKKLLQVMEKARIDGTTVETLTHAYRLNEKLIREISQLKEILASDKREEALAQHRLSNYQKESEEGLLNSILHTLVGEGRASESTYYSRHMLESITKKIQDCQESINEKEGQRNKKLEDGELTILRTIDASEGGFTDQILKTAKDSLALITGTRVSIERLLAANAKSRAASNEIASVLNSTSGRETILKGALQLVAKQTRLQGDSLGKEVERLAQAKAQVAADAAQFTLASVKLDKMAQTGQDALNYGRVLETRVTSFGMLASANVQAEARSQQFASLIESHHELLSNLQQQALPVTASALEMGLQQGVALRDGLLAAGVRDATKKAQLIFGSNLAGATDAQTRLESDNLDQMRAAIAALGKAQGLITDRTDKAIAHGLASMDLVEKVTVSAEAVSAALSDFQKVGAALASGDGPAT